MDIENRIELVSRAPTEELVTAKELRELFQAKDHPNHYIGYEISGQLHLGSLIFPGFKMRDLLEAGCNCTVFLADWHAWINNKLGGDWDRIKTAAKYYEEAFKLVSPKLKTVLGSDLYHDNDSHWKNLVLVSKHSTLHRVQRCLTIMGRKESEALDFSQFIYPPLQAADIRTMDIDIAHAGMDQRKVHMLCRDVFPKLKWKPPVALHHRLLPGLVKPERGGFDENEEVDRAITAKMSKSRPWTCLFIHDTKEQLAEKMKKAWCPEKTVADNGVLEYVRHVVFHEFKTLAVERPAKFGGPVEYASYAEVEQDFAAGNLHPMDLKAAVTDYIDRIIAPFREHFQKPAKAKLLEVYEGTEITR